METVYGQGHGGVQGHFHLTHRGTPILSGQSLHRYDFGRAATKWTKQNKMTKSYESSLFAKMIVIGVINLGRGMFVWHALKSMIEFN